MWGDMVFEMTRSFNREHFKLDQHIERLMAGVKILQIPLTETASQIRDAVKDGVDRNENAEAFGLGDEYRVMINVTRGLMPTYQGHVDIEWGPNVIISVYPLRWTVAGMGHLFDDGIDAVVTSQRQIPSQYLDAKIKHRSRLHLKMAEMEAAPKWPVLLDHNGYVTESSGANIIAVQNGMLILPHDNNALRGISRLYVIELAKQLGIGVHQYNLEPNDLIASHEVFFTATPWCMLPMRSLNGHMIGTGERPIYQRLLNQWSQNVGIDIAAQIKGWDNDRDNAGATAAAE